MWRTIVHNIISRRLHYGWVVVAVTALTLIISAGVRSAPGVMVVPLEQDLHWSRAAISLAVSIGLLCYGLTAPLSGSIMDRFGPRWVMVAGLAIMGVSMIASARMTEQWQLNLFWGALSGVGTGIVALVLGAAVAARWFVARRGLITGVFGASTSAGQLIFYPLLVWLVGTLGWRGSIMILAAVALVLLVPVLLLMRNRPTDVGQQPYGATSTVAEAIVEPAERQGIMRRAIAMPAFWLLTITFFICGATSNGLIGTHFIPHVGDHGISPNIAAGLLAIMGAMNFVGTIGSGWLTDRYNPRRLLAWYYGFRGLSLLLLPFVTSYTGLTAFAILFGLDYIATVPPTTALVADTFGHKHVGTVFGWIFCAHQIGAAMAAWLGGVAHDLLGHYGTAFLVAGILAIAAAALSLRIGRVPVPQQIEIASASQS
jgi:sugar phosphate permease